MGKQDVRAALEMMLADADVGDRFAEGDFSSASALELSDDEQTLVRDAASNLPDVAGFAMGATKLGAISDKWKYDFKFVPSLGPEYNKFVIAVDYSKI